jgi:predicted small secreted protein
MTRRTKLMNAALAVMAFALAACTSTGGTRDGSRTHQAAMSSASRTPQATPSTVTVLDLSDCRDVTCEAPLEPGRYRATFYGRTLEFEVSSPGWIWHYFYNFRFIADDTPTEGLYTSDSINFLPHPRIATRDCQDSADRSVGHSVHDLVSWLQTAPGLTVSEPIQVNVGGLDGVQLDLALDPAWKRTCFFSEGLPAVPLIVHKAKWGAYHFAMVPGVSMRWYVLHTDDGVLIIDIDDGPDNLSHEDLLATGIEIVESFAFSSS